MLEIDDTFKEWINENSEKWGLNASCEHWPKEDLEKMLKEAWASAFMEGYSLANTEDGSGFAKR